MNIWHTRLIIGLGTVALGLSTIAYTQEQEPPAQEQEPPAQEQEPPAQEQEQPAQEPPNKGLLATEINEGRKENAAEMRNYSWNTRTEVKMDGEVKSVKVELVRFTEDGELQKALVSDSAAGAKKPRGIRGKVASNKKKGMQEWAVELGNLLQQYSLPTSGSILDFLENATVQRTDNTVNLVGKDVIQQGDYLAILVDLSTIQLKIITVQTSLDGDAVDVKITSEHLDDGLSYTARQVVRVPAKKVELTIENYDFRRQ